MSGPFGLLVSLLTGLVLGCGGTGKGGDGPSNAGDPTEQQWSTDQPLGPGGTAPCGELANLELVPLDIWGRDLGDAALSLNYDPTLVDDPSVGPGVQVIRYGSVPVDLQVNWQADDYLDLSVLVSYDGAGSFAVDDPAEGRITVGSDLRRIDGTDCPISTLFLGMDHAWFAATGRAPSLNRVTLGRDGEDAWSGVAADLKTASDRVTWTTWWWESDFELLRPEGVYSMSDSARWANTAMGLLEGLPGVQRRVLLNRFWDEDSDWSKYLNADSDLRDKADQRGDDFEVILQGNSTEVPLFDEYAGEAADYDFGQRVLANPRYADRDVRTQPARVPVSVSLQVASFHQKALVVDGDVAWVGGMNVKASDWDTHDHRIYEPRRMDYDATSSDRNDVADGLTEPDHGPRKDYSIRVEGPAARDVEDIIWERWEAAIDGNDLYAENATRFDLDPVPDEPADGVLAQAITTLPPPWAEMSLQESHAKAVLQAQNYIFIEDQYFRAPLMVEHLVQALDADPDLVLIVVTKPVSSYDGGAKYTYLADATLRNRYPDRYLMVQLRSSDLYTDVGTFWDTVEVVSQDMDTHSKIRIVDDRYLSVGSCNFNNRGYKYEGELDVAVLDTATATSARQDILQNLVGDLWADMLSDDGRNNLDVLALAAEDNDQVLTWWEDYGSDLSVDSATSQWASYQPSGFVYPLEISSDYQFDVGPDAF